MMGPMQAVGAESLARVLVADDSAVVRAIVRRGLEASGYEVDEADNGSKA